MLVLVTYRPADAISGAHPIAALKQDLVLRRQAEELALGFLREESVGEYLAARFPGESMQKELGLLIHEHADGNPLFMVAVADYLTEQAGSPSTTHSGS